MKRMKLFSGAFVSILLLALLTSCGESTPSPAATPTRVSTPTTAPTPAPTATPVPFPGLAEWDLLMISDETNVGVANNYAKLIEADLHVKVNVHDCWSDLLNPTTALERLQNNSLSCVPDKRWADLVREAEVIVFYADGLDSMPKDGSWSTSPSWLSCVFFNASVTGLDQAAATTYKATIAKSCAPETTALYKTNMGAVYDKIFELRAGSPVILRSTDWYIPVLTPWQAAGVLDTCTPCIETASNAVHQVAADHKVLVGSSFTALNGTDHHTDPSKLGYIGSDGLLLSDLGAQQVAKALFQTGYAYAGK